MIKVAFFSIFALFMFIGCAKKEPIEVLPTTKKMNNEIKPLPIVEMPADFGVEYLAYKRVVDTVVIHTAYAQQGDPYEPKNLYNVFKKYNVSPHYMIDRNGTIYKMISENNLAHHAGKSKMADGREGVNAFSIGIELINSQIDYPTRAQYIALAKLINDIKTRHNIKFIIGHKDIAPTRKSDPWNFDFNELATLLQTQKYAKEATK